MQPMKFVVATMSLLVLVFVMGGTIVVVGWGIHPQGDHRRSKLNRSARSRHRAPVSSQGLDPLPLQLQLQLARSSAPVALDAAPGTR